MELPKFGNHATTRFLDDNGSTEEEVVNRRNGENVKPIRHNFRFMVRVNSLEDVERVSHEFWGEVINSDGKMHDAKLEQIKRPLGSKWNYWYMAKCYTILEY